MIIARIRNRIVWALAMFLSGSLLGCSARSGIDIWTAVEQENLEAIQRYGDSGADLEVGSTIRGSTPLLHALNLKKKESYRKLLEVGASPNTLCRGGAVVVHYAAAQEDSYWLRLALESGANANLFNEKGRAWARTFPLLFAIHQGTLENVKLLCEHGADIDAVGDKYGRTILTMAWAAAKFEVVHYLLEKGADYNKPAPMAATFVYLAKGASPELYRQHRNDTERWCRAVLDWLVAHGADPEKAVWDGTRWKFE